MNRPIRTTESPIKRIRTTKSLVRHIDPAAVAKALGAEPTGDKIPHAGPLTLYALRTELFRRRVSSGGRPGIAGTDQRQKIPVSDKDWAKLEMLASELGGPGSSPSAGQIASVLLSLALETVAPQTGPSDNPKDRPLSERLAQKLTSKT